MANTDPQTSPALATFLSGMRGRDSATVGLMATGLTVDAAAQERAARAYQLACEGHVCAATAVRDGYQVAMVGGEAIVTSPGQMEGNPAWVLTLWGMALDGCADETRGADGWASWFRVDGLPPHVAAQVVAREGEGTAWVGVWQDDSGFIGYRGARRVPRY